MSLPCNSSVHFDGHLEFDGKIWESDAFSWSKGVAFAVSELITGAIVSLRRNLVNVEKSLLRLNHIINTILRTVSSICFQDEEENKTRIS